MQRTMQSAFKRISIIAACVLSLLGGAVSAAPPNFVIIFTDDQGYADLSCFGSKEIRTPNIDRMAEAIIIEQIRETYPDHAILAEESGSIQGNSEFTWIIDPLDGTLNFLQGIPHFSVSIGIMKGLHHEHGVIVDPVRGDEFVASRGSGAQLNGKRIRVSARAKIEDCVLATSIPPGSIENRLETHMDSVKRITRTCRAVRQGGSAALDLA